MRPASLHSGARGTTTLEVGVQQETKRCGRCKATKPVEEFYRQSRSPDGRQSDCKNCQRERLDTWEAENRERVNAQARARYNANPQLHRGRWREWAEANAEALKESRRRFERENREWRNQQHREQRARDPERKKKANARKAVDRAIERGSLVRQPCRICGTTENVHGHHWSHEREHWLDVYWLCVACHRRVDAGWYVIVRPKMVTDLRRKLEEAKTS